MGLLDDAIREHLELKRRRGADPTEIEREESEALGPVRRGDVELDDEPHDGPDADEPAGLEDPGAAYAEEPAAVAAPLAPDPRDDHPVPAEPPETHDAPFAESEDESATPPHGDPWVQQPTREFSSDELNQALTDADEHHHEQAPPAEAPVDPDVVPADSDADPDDVLEETPEFLQETPEHDRLWFEQKPPKDFDF
jgi:hypothetical protein